VLPPFDHFFEAVIAAAPGAAPLLHVEIDCVETFPLPTRPTHACSAWRSRKSRSGRRIATPPGR
jgi:hypothetical protein